MKRDDTDVVDAVLAYVSAMFAGVGVLFLFLAGAVFFS
jgi:hypothetical protein